MFELKRPLSRRSVMLAGGALLLGLHLWLVVHALVGHVLYLGGDSMRDAWPAWKFLQTGRVDRALASPYESGLFPLLLTPFLALFGNTILCLKVASAALTSATVVLFYGFLYRAFGVLAALCLGAVCATSPLLLTHAAWGSLYAVAPWTALILFLSTLSDPRARAVTWAAAGLFTAFNAYFIFPLFVFGLWRGFPAPTERMARARALPRPAAFWAFALGVVPLAYRIAAAHGSGDVGSWLDQFWRTSLEHWRHPLNSVSAVWRQMSWSLDSAHFYHSRLGAPLMDAVSCSWLALTAAGAMWRRTRRLTFALLSGLAAAAFIQSLAGVALRHMLAFLPFQWLLLAPMIATPRGRWMRHVAGSFAFLLTLRQLGLDLFFIAAVQATGATITRDLAALAQELADRPASSATVAADNPNLYLGLLFLAPSHEIRYVDSAGKLASGQGIVLLSAGRPLRDTEDLFRAKIAGRRYALLTGRTRYEILEDGARL